MFKIRTFPIKDRDRDFHRDKHLSSFDKRGSQLSRFTSTVPETTPRIFIFCTHLRPSGLSWRSFQAQSHMASVLETFSFASVPFSYKNIARKSETRERSFLTIAVVSSAYCPTLNWIPPAPGRRKPSMSVESLTFAS